MARKAYARRYAQAVFELALQSEKLSEWWADLDKIVSVVGDAAFAAFLESPKIHFENKERLLLERLATVSPLALNLVRLLITKTRLSMVNDIAFEYQRLLDVYHGVAQAEVITAIALSEEKNKEVTRYLEEITGKKVVLKPAVNPDLIGGMVVRIGGKLLDGSTHSKLAALKRAMAEGE